MNAIVNSNKLQSIIVTGKGQTYNINMLNKIGLKYEI